jgi:hypothetical protein
MCYLGIDFDARIPKRCSDFVKMFGESGYLINIYPIIMKEPHFEGLSQKYLGQPPSRKGENVIQ